MPIHRGKDSNGQMKRKLYLKDKERYIGSLCRFCFDTNLRDYSRDYSGAYSHCDCANYVMYSKKTKDILLTFFEPVYTDIILKLLHPWGIFTL